MSLQNTFKFGALAIALVCGAAHADTSEVTNFNNQYSLKTDVSGSNGIYTFTYTVTNLAQGYGDGSQTGFDGLTILIPTAATVIGHTEAAPYAGAPGNWTYGTSGGLELSLNPSAPNANLTQNMSAPAGYTAVNWWGQNTQSVYPIDKSATFSITLSGVAVGESQVGISSYFGTGTPPVGQNFVTNQYGNYTTFTANAASAIAAVPEPETYAMLLGGLALVGAIARRRRQA